MTKEDMGQGIFRESILIRVEKKDFNQCEKSARKNNTVSYGMITPTLISMEPF